MHYTELTTDQSNGIHFPQFWCYFDLHGNTTRMSNDPRVRKKEKNPPTPVTIAPAKARLEKINRRVGRRYSQWLDTRKNRKQFLKIPEAIPEGEEKAYKFEEQQEEAAAVEAECCEKEKNAERQRKLQEKYQQLKQDREQKQKQQKKKQLQDDDDDDTVITEITQDSSLDDQELECNLIDEEEDKYDNNIVIIPTQVLIKMNYTTSNWKWKNKRKQQRKKERYSRKMKMKKKIASMIMNATNEYPLVKKM